MQRVLPSQIGAFLRQNFKERKDLELSTVQQLIGAVAGFLDLYDHLPDELIQLTEPDYAELVATVGAIRMATDQWRYGNNPDCMRPIGRALPRAWALIEKLPDAVPSALHDLSFIADDDLQRMIGLDIAAISADLQSGEWKGATLLAGSCCEALLLYGLQTVQAKDAAAVATAISAVPWPQGRSPKPSDLLHKSWDLFSYAAVADRLELISINTKSEIDPARDYRNLIHPAKSMRELVTCDRGTALVGAGAVEHIISDLRRNL